MKIDDLTITKINDFLKKTSVELAYVYGSRARNQATANSDLDICLVTKEPEKVLYDDLYLSFCQIFPKINIDLRLATTNSSPVYLFQVIKKGLNLYKKSEASRIKFEVKVMREYYDNAHMRSIFDNHLKQFFS